MRNYCHILILLLLSVANSGCKKMKYQDDDRTLQKQPYHGGAIRTDGYYYKTYGNPERMDIYLFYNNGIAIYGETPLTTELSSHEEKFRNGSYYDLIKDKKYYWGLFNIEDSMIKYELWKLENLYCKALLYSGKVLNDTTFRITQSMRSNGENLTNVDWLYHFREFSPKPDSTNGFIE